MATSAPAPTQKQYTTDGIEITTFTATEIAAVAANRAAAEAAEAETPAE